MVGSRGLVGTEGRHLLTTYSRCFLFARAANIAGDMLGSPCASELHINICQAGRRPDAYRDVQEELPIGGGRGLGGDAHAPDSSGRTVARNLPLSHLPRCPLPWRNHYPLRQDAAFRSSLNRRSLQGSNPGMRYADCPLRHARVCRSLPRSPPVTWPTAPEAGTCSTP